MKITKWKSIFKEEEYQQIQKGDEVLGGKFKNKKMIVQDFGTDKNNQPTVKTDKDEKPLYNFRISKLMKKEENSTLDFIKNNLGKDLAIKKRGRFGTYHWEINSKIDSREKSDYQKRINADTEQEALKQYYDRYIKK